MLTRLKISGFKNLIDVDIRFGPFTCIAGANGVGKSNLFDAIRFLSALADMPLMDAAASVRDEAQHSRDVHALFHRTGAGFDTEMTFEAEMIVPLRGVDDLGREAKATNSFLRYEVRVANRNGGSYTGDSLRLLSESLVPINKSDSVKHLFFPHEKVWRDSVIDSGRRKNAFISSTPDGMISVHHDGKDMGQPSAVLAEMLPRTLISAAKKITDGPTMLLARREMQSWRLLQLEPSALRRPDEFTATPHLQMDGAHLPATLYRLAREIPDGAAEDPGAVGNGEDNAVYAEIANRLSELIDDVRTVHIDRDERRELLTLMASLRDGTTHSAKALSDGTLRFLALSVLEMDPQESGLICLEEPENGIHPARIPAMLRLLQEVATDPTLPVDETNPLRQVIINTHSPAVVQQVPEDSLIVAQLRETVSDGHRYKRANFGYLENTWREKAAKADEKTPDIISKDVLLSYLNPVAPEADYAAGYSSAVVVQINGQAGPPTIARRVIDRDDMKQLMLPLSEIN